MVLNWFDEYEWLYNERFKKNFLMPDSEGTLIQSAINALKVCLIEKSLCTSETMSKTIQMLADSFEILNTAQQIQDSPLTRRLRDRIQPPTLTMRTILQVLVMYPKLSAIVTSCLSRMVKTGQVEKFDWVWDGFVQCVIKLKHNAFDLIG